MVAGQMALLVQIISIGLMILIPLFFIWWIWTFVALFAEKMKSGGKRVDVIKWLTLWGLGMLIILLLIAGYYFFGVKGMALIAVIVCPFYMVYLKRQKQKALMKAESREITNHGK